MKDLCIVLIVLLVLSHLNTVYLAQRLKKLRMAGDELRRAANGIFYPHTVLSLKRHISEAIEKYDCAR